MWQRTPESGPVLAWRPVGRWVASRTVEPSFPSWPLRSAGASAVLLLLLVSFGLGAGLALAQPLTNSVEIIYPNQDYQKIPDLLPIVIRVTVASDSRLADLVVEIKDITHWLVRSNKDDPHPVLSQSPPRDRSACEVHQSQRSLRACDLAGSCSPHLYHEPGGSARL